MRIPVRVDYGLRALLILADRYGQGLTPSSEIAAQQDIPEPYLDQLLNTLQKGGLVRSVRGPKGGHTLAREPEHITVAEAVAVLEGSASLVDCLDEEAACERASVCALREVWQEVEAAVRRVLGNVTLAELARRQAAHEEREVYHI